MYMLDKGSSGGKGIYMYKTHKILLYTNLCLFMENFFKILN